jgi:N-acetylglucosaminyldiphosphoundecaprenol N-acetyl-beta-D-mannosaminyltransferase
MHAVQAASPTVHPKRLSLFGLHVDLVNFEDAVAAIHEAIERRASMHVVTLDASMCVLARKDLELRKIIEKAELVTPDSAGVLWACRRRGTHLRERVSGVELVERLCKDSAEKGTRLFFLGAAPGVADGAADRMRERYTGCQVVGALDGYFAPEDESGIQERVREARPDALCVAMGIPKQEKLIARWHPELEVPVMIGVGGTFDVLSGQVARAPKWIQRLNLEWLHRLVKNPRKLRKAMTLPRFWWMEITSWRR